MSPLRKKSPTDSDRRLAPRVSTASFALAACFVLGAASGFASDVVTYHNDNARTGQYLQEIILNHSNVRSSTFGKLFTLPVDSVIDAQPLYLSAVSIAGELEVGVFIALPALKLTISVAAPILEFLSIACC